MRGKELLKGKELKGQAKARVKLSVVIGLSQPWGDDCTIGQALTQGRRDAEELLRRRLGEVPEVREMTLHSIQLIMEQSDE